jgi:hypothetical protein
VIQGNQFVVPFAAGELQQAHGGNGTLVIQPEPYGAIDFISGEVVAAKNWAVNSEGALRCG